MLARGIIGQIKYSLYRRKNKTSVCIFCRENIASSKRPILKETATMYVTANDFPYKRWAHQAVKHHLIVTPKRHTLQIIELSDTERDEMMQLIALYDKEGYSFYIRSHADASRSVTHVHGHLFLYR